MGPEKLPELFQDSTVTCPQSKDGPEITFTTIRTIGSGSFGVVFIAKTNTGELIAVKKVFQDRKYRNRELSIMQELGEHPFIIRLINSYISVAENQTNGDYLNILMDYYPENGYQIYKSYIRAGIKMPMFQIKLYTFQFLRGLAYMHSLNIANRDLKPQNTLVNRETGRAVLCDLGSAKKLNPAESNISYICSRYYRAPELIFGARNYTTVIDVWSFGCVVAEMVIGKPIFGGTTPLDQVIEIIKVLGPPSSREMRDMNNTLKEYTFPTIRTTPLADVLGTKDPVVLDFFTRCFKYSPNERITAYEALAHPFYDDLRARDAPIPKGLKLFEFSEQERQSMAPDLLSKIRPQ